MPVHGEVTYRVKEALLYLRHFTIPQLIDSTGLRPKSVERTVHKLVEEGYLRSSPDSAPRSGPGRPPRVYILTDDKEKIDQLHDVVTAFRTRLGVDSLRYREPTSAYYRDALRMLADVSERPQHNLYDILPRIRMTLDFCRTYEPRLTDSTYEVTPYLDLAEARLAHLEGNHQVRDRLIEEARAAFDREGMVDQVRTVRELGLELVLDEVEIGLSRPNPLPYVPEALGRIKLELRSLASTERLRATIDKIFSDLETLIARHARNAAEIQRGSSVVRSVQKGADEPVSPPHPRSIVEFLGSVIEVNTGTAPSGILATRNFSGTVRTISTSSKAIVEQSSQGAGQEATRDLVGGANNSLLFASAAAHSDE